jgi:hypothetical protein
MKPGGGMGRDGVWKKPERPPRVSFFGVKSRNLTTGFFRAGFLLGIEVGLCTTGGGSPSHGPDLRSELRSFQNQNRSDFWVRFLRLPFVVASAAKHGLPPEDAARGSGFRSLGIPG